MLAISSQVVPFALQSWLWNCDQSKFTIPAISGYLNDFPRNGWLSVKVARNLYLDNVDESEIEAEMARITQEKT